MSEKDLDRYCSRAVDGGATHAKLIRPGSVTTASWVRLKCQFGCPGFDKGYCCPPHTPTAEQTRKILDAYKRGILFHLEFPRNPELGSRAKRIRKTFDMLIDLEEEMFKDGYYKAFVFLAGPCRLCETCGKIDGEPCRFLYRARPSMESCGIDVYETARTNGFFIQPLREKAETQNKYCLMLVD